MKLPAKVGSLALMLLLLLMPSSDAFLLTRVEPGVVTVEPGDSISMLCVVSPNIL